MVCMVILSRLAHVTSYSVIIILVATSAALIVLIMEEEEEMVGRQFNRFEELEHLASIGCEKSSYVAISIASLN